MLKRTENRGLRKCLSFLLIHLLLISQLPYLYATVPSNVRYNERYGRTRDSYDGDNGKMIIHIQDAHCIYEAQKNIVGIVRDLYNNHNVRLITVEGADAYFNADELAAFPVQSIKDDVAEFFLKNGRISGAEYLLIQNDLPLALRGAENRDLYIENYNSFLNAMPKPGDKVMTAIDMLDSALETLKILMLNDDLRELDVFHHMHSNGQIEFIDYANYLIGKAGSVDISFENMPNIQILMQSQELEESIDFATIHIEVGELIDAVADIIDREQLTELLNKNLFYKIGRIPPYVFFSFLQEICNKNNIAISAYPNLNTYCEYLGLYDSIDDVAVVSELYDLESDVMEMMFADPIQKELISVSQDISLLRKLMSLKVSKLELKRFQADTDKFTEQRFLAFLKKTVPTYDIPFNFDYDFSAISLKLPMIDNFYKVAVKRNEALIENTLAEMDLEDSNIAVLITGGFHTQGITDILKDEGISYRVISPSITEQPETSYYLTRLTGMPTDIEDRLTANKLQIPLVLADPAIIPDVAAAENFKTAFKTLMEAHPEAVNLEQILAGKPTGYTPTVTFTDAFMIDNIRYLSFNIEGRKMFLAVGAKDMKTVAGVQPTVIGEYAYGFIQEDTFVAQAQNPNRRMIEKQTDLRITIENALARGEKVDLTESQLVWNEQNNADFQDMLARGFLVKQAEGSYLPSIGFLLNSNLSALVVKPRVAQIDSLDAANREFFARRGIKRIEVFSNQTDLTAQDVQLLQQGLSDLMSNKKIELTNGKVVRAVVDAQTGFMQIYSMAPQGPLQIRPQIVINQQIFDAMLPQADRIQVTSALQSQRQGYISIDAMTRTVTLYELNQEGLRSPVGPPTVLPPNITSADVLASVLEMRKRAEEAGIGLIGYGNPEAGYSIAFENLNELLDAVENSPQVKAFLNVHRLLSVVPSLQDIDLTGKQDFNTLMDYLYSLMPDPKTYDDRITCAAASAALLHNVVKIDGIPINFLYLQRKWLLERMLPLIDQRMKGAIPINSETKEPEYSLYAIQQAYTLMGQTSQALKTDLAGLRNLLKKLPVGESVMVHLHIAERKHFIGIRSTDQGFEVQDLTMTKDKIIKPRREFVLMSLDAIIDRYSRAFTGNILVSENLPDVTAPVLAQFISDGTFKILDVDEQLAAVGATSHSMEMLVFHQKDASTPLILAQEMIQSMAPEQPAAGIGGYSMRMAFRRPTHKYLMQPPDDDEPIEMVTVEMFFDVTFNPVTKELQAKVRQVVDGRTTYLTVSPTGEIIPTLAPTQQELDAMNLTLEQWEERFVVRFSVDQIIAIFGEDVAEAIGIYRKRIARLTPENVDEHILDIFNIITAKMLEDMITPELVLTRITGYVKNASDFQPEVVRRVDLNNSYDNLALNKIREALGMINLERDDVLLLVRQGSFEMDDQGKVSVVPERMLDLLATIQKTDLTTITQEGIYNELVGQALVKYRDGALIDAVAQGLPADARNIVESLFVENYSGSKDLQNINDIVREVIAKAYTNRLIPDATSTFFSGEQWPVVINAIELILNDIAPELLTVINPTTDTPQANITRIISQMQMELGLQVTPDIRNAVANKEETRYISSVISDKTASAITYLNDRIARVGLIAAMTEGQTLNQRIKADMDIANQRDMQKMELIPNITAINADFFDTKDDINDSRTIGVTQKIRQAAADPKKLFVIYSLSDDDAMIKAKLAPKGITEDMVTIVSAVMFEKAAAEDPAIKYMPGHATNILMLPRIVKQARGIADNVDLRMMDFSILDNNPDVVQVALDNLASVFEVPAGLDDSQLTEGQLIETGISALELVEMLEQMGEPNATLPEDLLITYVSEKNRYLHDAFVNLKEIHNTDEISIKLLLGYLKMTSLSKEDLRGVRVKRKVTVNKGFIEKLQAQRALDISA